MTTAVVFVDRLTPLSLIRCVVLRPGQIVWFDPPTRSGRLVSRIFFAMGLIGAKPPRPIRGHAGAMRDPDGGSTYVRVARDARNLARDVRAAEFAHSPVIQALATRWQPEKVALHFEKLAEEELKGECLRIEMSRWNTAGEARADGRCVLVVGRGRWHSYLARYASSRLVDLKSYYRAGPTWSLLHRVLRAFARSVTRRRAPKVAVAALPAERPDAQPVQSDALGLSYGYRSIDFSADMRSEFAWVDGPLQPSTEVLLHSYSGPPVPPEVAREARERGIRITRAPALTEMSPPPRVFLRLAARYAGAVARAIVAGIRSASARHAGEFLRLAVRVAYWQAFFVSNRVRVDLGVGSVSTDVPKTLALDAIGGVSIGYQYSISFSANSDTTLLGAGEDVQFVFSPFFADMWGRMNPPPSATVETGFPYDTAVAALTGARATAPTRVSLQGAGAKFILAYFDENSVSQWNSPADDEDLCAEYHFLLNWLLADEELGLICKPKISGNLARRLAPVAEIVAKAEETGRFRIVTSSEQVSHVYPAEVALCSDLAIGKLSGATAAMESALAGVPTVLVDTDGLHSHPFYSIAGPGVIFRDWESLRTRVDAYRADPASAGCFGNWQTLLAVLDPFRDGRARDRINGYLSCIFREITRGETKADAIRIASGEHQRMWSAPSEVAPQRAAVSNVVNHPSAKAALQLLSRK